MTVNKPTKDNNLLLHAIVSPVCDFSKPGAKDALSNRVKKLNDADRSELMKSLTEIKQRIAVPPKDGKPLKERAVVVLLLNDDGVKDDPCFIVSAIRAVLNFLGLRYSSTSIVKEIEAIREKFPATEHVKNVEDYSTVLGQMLTDLEKKIEKPGPQEAVKELHDLIDQARTAFTVAKNAEWNRVDVFLNFYDALELFKGTLGARADISVGINRAIAKKVEEIKTIHQAWEKNETIIAFFDELKTKVSDGSITEKGWETKDLDNAKKTLGSLYAGKNYGKSKDAIVIPFILNCFDDIDVLLDSASSSYDSKKYGNQIEFNVINNRSKRYENNKKVIENNNYLIKFISEVKLLEEDCSNLDQICNTVKFLMGGQVLEGIKRRLKVAVDSFKDASDILKKTNNFEVHLQALNEYACANTGSISDVCKQTLSDGLFKLEIINGAKDFNEIHQRLSSFKNKTKLLDFSDEGKKQFINDYIAYWSKHFEGLKTVKHKELADGHQIVKSLASGLNISTSPASTTITKIPIALPISPIATSSVPASAPTPSPTAATATLIPKTAAVSNPTPPSAPVSSTPSSAPAPTKPTLAQLAVDLKANRANPDAAQKLYSQVTPENYGAQANLIYGAFYKIMADKGKTFGENKQWGELIFIKGTVRDPGTGREVGPTVTPAELNDARVEAINKILHPTS